MQQRWTWSLAVLGLFGGLGVTTYVQSDPLALAPDPHASALAELRVELFRLQSELDSSRERLARIDDSEARGIQLAARIVRMEAELVESRELLARQREHLRQLESSSRQAVVQAVDRELTGFARDMGEQWEGLRGVVDEISGLARQHEGTLAELRRGMRRDTTRMWRDLLGPTVQLAGTSTVGSGVLLPSIPLEEGGHRTYLLTAWHVVRDILPGQKAQTESVPVHVYHPDGTKTFESARLLAHDAAIDSALLVMNTEKAFDFGARLAPREHLAGVAIFGSVYAVGCPLGNDPIPTFGEVADVRHQVDGEAYWMISAPTYIGNSGGGIFDAETHELIGIFSKIYTHGTLRPTVVPHMGLVTPLERVYDWLARSGYGELVPTAPAAPAQMLVVEGQSESAVQPAPRLRFASMAGEAEGH